jgi:hypothetical protein
MIARPRKNDPSLEALLVAPGPLDTGTGHADKFAAHDRLALRTAAIAFRHFDGLSIRDVANGRRNRSVGEYVSYKAGLRLGFESSHEMLDHYLNEVEPEIFHMLAQPHTIQFMWHGKRYRYTPDLELWTERGHFVREIKEQSELMSDHGLRRKLALVEEIYHRAGFCFQLLMDKDIRVEPRLGNAILIQKYRRLGVSPCTEARLIEHLDRNNGVSTLDACAKSLKLAHGEREIMMTMMCRRLVHIDLSKPINTYSSVYRHYAQEPPQPSIAIRRTKLPRGSMGRV